MPLDKEKVCRMLLERWATAPQMRTELPYLAEQLGGEFDNDPFKTYEQSGLYMASRKLVRAEIVIPTIGVIPRGAVFRFNTGANREDLLVLDGSLEAVVIEPNRIGQTNFTPNISHLRKYSALTAPAGSDIILDARGDTYYLCRYTPQPVQPAKS